MSQSIRAWYRQPQAWLDTALWRTLIVANRLRLRWPRSGALLRKAVLVVWWTCTLQLFAQLGFWLRARRQRAANPPVAPFILIESVDPARLVLPTSDAPQVSVIIPTYGKTDFTLRCLASIAAYPPVVPIEIIVVDDASPDPEVACLAQVQGIRLLRNHANIGYLHSCNVASRLATGQYLLFLNNDTQVLPDWLDPMLALFDAYQDVGAVGAKLLYPDGRLQEAGGIIWRDGSGWNFGRHEDPDRPVFNYVREVDYCSGAALLVPHPVFDRIGRFDERYAPAYFEDSDLCFRLRSAGLKTMYQPLSRIVHFEGVSHGRDVAVGGKSYQVTNRKTFLRAWGEVLQHDHFPNGANVLRARDRARHRAVVLVVDHMVPTPDRDAGSRTMLDFMRALRDAGMVVKFWPHNLFYTPGYTEALQHMGVEVFHGANHETFQSWMRTHGASLDHVLLSRPDVAESCLPVVRQHSRARISYYGHDLHFRRLRLQGEMLGEERLLRTADRMEERETAVWRAVDAVLYPSEEEAAIVRCMQPAANVRAILPWCFDSFGQPRTAPPRGEILFVAGFGHAPNEDAVCWFVQAILPLILACVPDASLAVVGSNPTPLVRALAGGAVQVCADVSDAELAAWYRRARVAVVPLRCGAGVKLKTVEALREGVPLVVTPIGAQGLPGLEAIVPVVGEPSRFAASVCDLLLKDTLWEQRCADQIAYARERFMPAALHDSLLRAMHPEPAAHLVAAA